MTPEEEGGSPNYRELRLRDLRPVDEPVMVIGRVTRAERREIPRRDGKGTRTILSGTMTDGTATVRFTWWEPPSEEVEPGMVLRAVRVEIREFRGHAELSFGARTRVFPAEESELPQGIAAEALPATLAALPESLDGFRLDVRVVSARTKTVSVRGEPRTITEGVLADATGRVSFTAWKSFPLRAGEPVRVLGARLRSFRGQPQVSLDEGSVVERLRDDAVPPLAPGSGETDLPLDEIGAHGGGPDVRFAGTVVGLLPPSGVVHRCPMCRRTLSSGRCREHGAVEGTVDLRTRLVVDDGTGSATVELGKEATEEILGQRLTEVLAAPGAESEPPLEDRLIDRTFGRHCSVTGRASSDEFGLTVFPDTFRWTEVSAGPLLAAARSELDRADQ